MFVGKAVLPPARTTAKRKITWGNYRMLSHEKSCIILSQVSRESLLRFIDKASCFCYNLQIMNHETNPGSTPVDPRIVHLGDDLRFSPDIGEMLFEMNTREALDLANKAQPMGQFARPDFFTSEDFAKPGQDGPADRPDDIV